MRGSSCTFKCQCQHYNLEELSNPGKTHLFFWTCFFQILLLDWKLNFELLTWIVDLNLELKSSPRFQARSQQIISVSDAHPDAFWMSCARRDYESKVECVDMNLPVILNFERCTSISRISMRGEPRLISSVVEMPICLNETPGTSIIWRQELNPQTYIDGLDVRIVWWSFEFPARDMSIKDSHFDDRVGYTLSRPR